MENKSSIQSLARAFGIMEIIADSGSGMSVAAICRASGLHKSTVYRMLVALRELGYVMQKPDGDYRLTFKVCHLSRRVIGGVNLVSVAKRHLKTLCESTHETVHLVMRENNDVVFLHREECFDTPVRVVSSVGKYLPMHTSAVGKSILATLDDGAVSAYWQQVDKPKITASTICEFDELMADLARTRARSYAIDNEENTDGVRCIAIALCDYIGRSNAAISVSGPKDRMTDSRLATIFPAIQKARDGIVADMGYSTL